VTHSSRARTVVALVLGLTVLVGASTTVSLLASHGALNEARRHEGALVGGLAFAIACTLVNLSLRWLRWHNLVRRCGATMPTRESVMLYAATLPAVVTPFYLGELIRPWLLRRRFPGRTPQFVTVWWLERVADTAAVVSWFAFGRHRPLIALIVLLVWAGVHLGSARLVRGTQHTLGRPSAVVMTAVLTWTAWALPGLALAELARHLGATSGGETLAAVFYRASALGGLTGSPLGIGVTGELMAQGLRHAGMAASVAALAVATVRAGTSWFAVLLGGLAVVAYRRPLRAYLGPVASVSTAPHFEGLAEHYEHELPAHVRARLIDRKIAFMPASSTNGRALEVGCGQGWYSAAMARRGWTMSAFDVSPAQTDFAARTFERETVAVGLSVADGARLPYRDDTFDVVYAINVLHHILDRDALGATLGEIVRVLKPGGAFYLQEMNTTNPVFRFHLGYIYPLLHRIDEGTELWVRPTQLPTVAHASWSPDVDYFTFIPEFVPSVVTRRLDGFERRLEHSRWRSLSAHYVARLVKEPTPVRV
jgi:ubiquinone/menaquinone biosynthesis C-methylase UbiE